MAVITMPTDLLVGAASMGQVRYDLVEQSETTGDVTTRLLAPPRWRLNLRAQAVMDFVNAGKWEALVFGARGRVNHIACFDPGRAVPQGTMRGAPRLAAQLAVGATSMTLYNGTAGTWKAGDPLQIGTGLGTSQYVKAMADAVSSPATSVAFSWTNAGAFSWTNGGAFSWSDEGLITITFEPPARQLYPAGTLVTWDRPVFYGKQTSDTPTGTYVPGYTGQGGYELDLLEQFS